MEIDRNLGILIQQSKREGAIADDSFEVLLNEQKAHKWIESILFLLKKPFLKKKSYVLKSRELGIEISLLEEGNLVLLTIIVPLDVLAILLTHQDGIQKRIQMLYPMKQISIHFESK